MLKTVTTPKSSKSKCCMCGAQGRDDFGIKISTYLSIVVGNSERAHEVQPQIAGAIRLTVKSLWVTSRVHFQAWVARGENAQKSVVCPLHGFKRMDMEWESKKESVCEFCSFPSENASWVRVICPLCEFEGAEKGKIMLHGPGREKYDHVGGCMRKWQWKGKQNSPPFRPPLLFSWAVCAIISRAF